MSGGASPSSALSKKKKKSDGKGQSQLNKCLNEKRRRELENIYIEELAELISASFADMSSLSVKPDKCAILQETVKQVRAGIHRISTEQTGSLISTTEAAAVQQGEVSSSKSTNLSNTELSPLLLSILDGFLFVVNPDGQIEFVTENIQQFLHYDKEELLGKSVYNIIHHGDHTRFGVLLNNPLVICGSSIVSPGSNLATTPHMEQSPSGSKGNSWNQRFTTKFNCRLLIKPPTDQDQSIEEKQSIVCQYETLEISSTKMNGGIVDDEESTDGSNQNLLCIARRVSYNKKHLSPPLEQFTIKLDPHGKILDFNFKNISDKYAQHINEDCLVGKLLHEKCHTNDVLNVANHLQETRRSGFSTSPIYKLHLAEEKYINVQTNSKYFKSNNNQKSDYIMATHSIIGDNEMCAMIESNSIASCATADPCISLNGTDSLPSMTSSVGSNQPVSSLQSESKFISSDYSMTSPTDLNFSDFGLFPSTTFGDMLQENKWSEQSTNSVETPPKTTPVPSPATVSSNPHTPVAQPQYTSFPFSPLLPSSKDSFDSGGNVERMESARLRTLLTTSKRSDGISEENNVKNKHNILKGLLNPDDISTQSVNDESTNQSTPSSPANLRQTPHNNSNMNDAPSTPNNATTSNNNNNMLQKLLNDKNEDADVEARAGLKKQNELLQELLKEDDNVNKHDIMLEQNSQHSSNEDLILKSMGFRILSPTSPESHNHSRKRNSISADDENDIPPLKRNAGPSVLETLSNPSSGSQTQVTNSKLQERNKMLASLLAKDPPPTAIPAIPASVISATPQDKLVTIIKQQQQQQQQQPVGSWSVSSGQHSISLSQNMQHSQLQNHQRALLQKSGNNLYLNHMLDQPQASQSQNQIQIQHIRQVMTSSASSSYNSQLNNMVESNSNSLPFNSDPELSELLEEVMDIMNVTSDNSTLLNLFNVLETTNTPSPVGPNPTNQSSFNSIMNEKMAVNAIQKSLMQVESTVKSPSPLAYSSPTRGNLHPHNQFIPPPAYQSQQKNPVRFNPQQSPRLTGVPPYPKNVQTPPSPQQQQLLIQQQQKQRLIQQQQQKHRLLQQQQQQKIMVVTTNAASLPTPDPTTALQTIDSLLNNTGPPNVALQRSSSVPDSQSQLSPVYATSGSQQLLNSSQISPSSNRQPPYSTLTQQSFPMLNYGTTTQTQTTQAQQIIQQSTSRMSPSTHTQYQNPINPCVNQQQQTQNIYINQTQQPGVWTQQRLTLHQQQNPMLNAQLQITGGFNNNSVRQNFTNQQQQGNHGGTSRVLTSPVGYNTEVPPNTNCQQQSQQHQQQFRLPRNINMTSTNSQIPAGNNGVTEFTRNELRAFVGVRSQQQGGTRLSSQLLPGQSVTPTELDSLGLNFEMSPTGGNESPKWSGLNSDMSSSSSQQQGIPSRNPVDDSSRTSSANSTTSPGVTEQKSLLQKLLSEG